MNWKYIFIIISFSLKAQAEKEIIIYQREMDYMKINHM